MTLTNKQKAAIIEYMCGCSVKSILEDVNEIGNIWTEENDEQLRQAVRDIIERCKDKLFLNLTKD